MNGFQHGSQHLFHFWSDRCSFLVRFKTMGIWLVTSEVFCFFLRAVCQSEVKCFVLSDMKQSRVTLTIFLIKKLPALFFILFYGLIWTCLHALMSKNTLFSLMCSAVASLVILCIQHLVLDAASWRLPLLCSKWSAFIWHKLQYCAKSLDFAREKV